MSANSSVFLRDISNVIVGGVNFGSVADVLANHPDRRDELQAAFVAFVDALPAETTAEEMALVQSVADLFA